MRTLALAAGLAAQLACGPGFHAKTPAGFVELEDQKQYDYRAVSADGLVLAVREIEHEPRGELTFWARAIENQLRLRSGYALLAASDLRTQQGLRGRRLRFGHDKGREPHIYEVAVVTTESRIFVIEAGGTRALMERHARDIEQAMTAFQVD
jgi:hypothetical protein